MSQAQVPLSSCQTWPLRIQHLFLYHPAETRGRSVQLHRLIDIMAIAISGIDWKERTVRRRLEPSDNLSKNGSNNGFLDRRNGIPSHDTFARVFNVLHSLQQC